MRLRDAMRFAEFWLSKSCVAGSGLKPGCCGWSKEGYLFS